MENKDPDSSNRLSGNVKMYQQTETWNLFQQKFWQFHDDINKFLLQFASGPMTEECLLCQQQKEALYSTKRWWNIRNSLF